MILNPTSEEDGEMITCMRAGELWRESVNSGLSTCQLSADIRDKRVLNLRL